MKPSKSASTSSTGIAFSMACKRNAGTHCRVTVDNMPSAPRPTRATSNTSGFSSAEHSTTEPSAVTSRSATIRLEMLPNLVPGAVRGGGRRAGDRLVGDVAHVLEGEAASVELVTQLRQRDAGLHRDGVVRGIVRQHLAVVRHVDEVSVGAGDAGERMPGAHHLDAPLVGRGLLHDLHELGLGRRPLLRERGTDLVPGPVLPEFRHLARHRPAFLRESRTRSVRGAS